MIVFAFLRAVVKAIRDAHRAWRIEEAWRRDMLKVFVGRKRLKAGDKCPQCEGSGKIHVHGHQDGPCMWEQDCDLCRGAGVLGGKVAAR